MTQIKLIFVFLNTDSLYLNMDSSYLNTDYMDYMEFTEFIFDTNDH